MDIQDILRWSARHCRQRLFESLLIVLIICLGVAAIVAISIIVVNLNDELNHSQHDFTMRTFNVNSGVDLSIRATSDTPLVFKDDESQRTDLVWLSLTDIESFKNQLSSGLYVFGELTRQYTSSLIPAGSMTNFALTGTTLDAIKFREYELAEGAWFIDADVENHNQVVVLSDELAEFLFSDEHPIGKQLPLTVDRDEEHLYEIIGVLAPFDSSVYAASQNMTAYVPLTAMPQFVNDPQPQFTYFYVGVPAEFEIKKMYEQVKAEVELQFGGNAVLQGRFTRLYDNNREVMGLYSIIAVFASIGLVIAVINTLNLMLARMIRRYRSIGLSIALGASKKLIFIQSLSESIILSFFGTALGIGLSYGVLALINAATESTLNLGITPIMIGLGLGILGSIFFGVYPAYYGVKTNPIDALRME